MVEYWHWHSLHYGQETYWKGVLSHDLEPDRAYARSAAQRTNCSGWGRKSWISNGTTKSPFSTATTRATASTS